MGERNRVYVFKGPTEEEFRRAFAAVVAELGGQLNWDVHPKPIGSNLLTSHNGRCHAAYIHAREDEIPPRIGSRLQVPWMAARIQEGSHWDYSLFVGQDNLDNFSTLPEYWDDDPAFHASRRGDAGLLARTWQIERGAIENYLRPWGYVLIDEDTYETTLRGKAYPGDESGYGDIWQMNDFLRALGAHDPNWNEPHSISRSLEFPVRGLC